MDAKTVLPPEQIDDLRIENTSVALCELEIEPFARAIEQAVLQALAPWREALESIAAEENVYLGHGSYTTEPVLSAEQMQDLARHALMGASSPGAKQ